MKEKDVSPNTQTLHLHVIGHSEKGRLLEQNEDAFALSNLKDQKQAEQLGRLYLLADGKGDHGSAAIASRIAIETIPFVYYHQSDGDSPVGRLQQAFFAAHTRIRAFASLHQEYTGMATTCTAIVVRGTRIWIAHIGDSRVYLVHTLPRFQSAIERLTTDHSQVAAQVRAGEIPLERMRHSPSERDILLRALGSSEENNAYPDFTLRDVRPGDMLVLCSDGLWGAVSEEQIASIVDTMPAQQACDELIRLAKKTEGDEDMSVVLLSFSL